MAVQVADVFAGGRGRCVFERGAEPDAPISDGGPGEGVVIIWIRHDDQLEISPGLREQQLPGGLQCADRDVVEDDRKLRVLRNRGRWPLPIEMMRHQARHQAGIESPCLLPTLDTAGGVEVQLVVDLERRVEHEGGARLPGPPSQLAVLASPPAESLVESSQLTEEGERERYVRGDEGSKSLAAVLQAGGPPQQSASIVLGLPGCLVRRVGTTADHHRCRRRPVPGPVAFDEVRGERCSPSRARGGCRRWRELRPDSGPDRRRIRREVDSGSWISRPSTDSTTPRMSSSDPSSHTWTSKVDVSGCCANDASVRARSADRL